MFKKKKKKNDAFDLTVESKMEDVLFDNVYF